MNNYIDERHEEKQRKLEMLKVLLDSGIEDRGILAESLGMPRKSLNAYLRTLGVCDKRKHWNQDTITCREVYEAIVSPYKRPQRIERLIVDGKTYIDVTPFITDCGTAYDAR